MMFSPISLACDWNMPQFLLLSSKCGHHYHVLFSSQVLCTFFDSLLQINVAIRFCLFYEIIFKICVIIFFFQKGVYHILKQSFQLCKHFKDNNPCTCVYQNYYLFMYDFVFQKEGLHMEPSMKNSTSCILGTVHNSQLFTFFFVLPPCVQKIC